jgi:hypothetical protein
MSQRVPVGDVINEAFQFGLHRWFTVFRFAWLPFLLAATVIGGVFMLAFDVSAMSGQREVESMSELAGLLRVSPAAAAGLFAIAVVLILIAYSGVFASIYRLVALGEDRPGLFQLRFDGPAIRVFWAQLILTLINYGILIAAGMIALAVSGHSLGEVANAWREFVAMVAQASANPEAQPDEAALARIASPFGVFFLGFLFAAPVMIYVNIKLVPFAPGSAAENRLLLFGAIRMTTGHFWSILGVYILFILAMIVLGIVYTLAMSFIELMAGLGGAGALSLIGAIFTVVSFVAALVYQVFIIGVQLSLQAIVYRRLKTGQ